MARAQNLSRIATNDGHGENSSYFDGWKAYDKNPFHPTENPNGVIQMGLAENQLCFDLIKKWIKNHPEASICTLEGVDEFERIANFQDYHGLPEFRQTMSKFMSTIRGGRVTFDPDRIVMGRGATGTTEIIMFCLADPADAFLVPSPYYQAFNRDLCWRTGARIIPVPCYSSNNFNITRETLEGSYKEAQDKGINVKGLILANPSNPLGTTLDRKTLKDLVSFTNEKNIHFVCDEIYASCVFNSPHFISIAEIIQEMDCNRDLIHIIYSISKDMGLPGFRVGIVYSYNDVIVQCARRMSSFGLISSQTQHFLASLLSDDDFVSNFLAESSIRLKKRHNDCTEGLKELGINCLQSNAGLFVWMNLQHLLEEPTYNGELKLWRAIINDVKLNISPGISFHCPEPGWFRVCFANMDDETVKVALKRIRLFVVGDGDKKYEKEIENKVWKKKKLRLNVPSSGRPSEKGLGSPLSKRSPGSPIPLSPLVRART